MDVSHVLSFLVVSMLLTIAPGPDILFVIMQSISHGKKSGIATALGLCTGVTVHTLAAAFGISAILHESVLAFQILKYAGALYLLYLAWQAFKEGKQAFSTETVPKQSLSSLYKRGIFMNVLNPKVSLFFLAFLPQFVSPASGHMSIQMIFLGILFMLQAILIFTIVAVCAETFGRKIIGSTGAMKYVNVLKAGVFACISIRLAFYEK
jgi:threonine/homoserine/homoserine lactone efflux protein